MTDGTQRFIEYLSSLPSVESLVRVYYGGESSAQLQCFVAATAAFPEIKFEYTGVKHIPTLKWAPRDLIDWLIMSDFHIILTHVHQHNEHWHATEVVRELQRLRQHRGFPHGDTLNCPVFLQDKFAYLSSVPDITNPTLQIFLPTTDSPCVDKEQIELFCAENNHGNGWFLKPAFTTNGEGRTSCGSVQEIIHALDIANQKFKDRLPYMMLQSKMLNLKEYKIIVLNRKPQYICPQYQSHKHEIAFGKTKEGKQKLIEFARHAVMRLGESCPFALTQFMIRVDVMLSNCGKLVVNEFESFEAMFTGTAMQDIQVQRFLEAYFDAVLNIV